MLGQAGRVLGRGRGNGVCDAIHVQDGTTAAYCSLHEVAKVLLVIVLGRCECVYAFACMCAFLLCVCGGGC